MKKYEFLAVKAEKLADICDIRIHSLSKGMLLQMEYLRSNEALPQSHLVNCLSKICQISLDRVKLSNAIRGMKRSVKKFRPNKKMNEKNKGEI